MPNRIIKEQICTSPDISILSWFGEVLFYRLIVSCDDFGRCDGHPAIIKGRLFPLKNVTVKEIEAALTDLENNQMIVRYEVGGREFIQLTNWERHQSRRAKNSKFPAPEDGTPIAGASKRKQVLANVPEESRNRGVEESRNRGVEESRNRGIEESGETPCAEPETVSAPAVITLPLNDNSQYPVSQEQVGKWVELYPAVDIMQELRKMAGWLDANPKRRKTKQGILRFITSWLARAQDKGHVLPERGGRASPQPTGRAAVDELLAEMEAIDI